jgi:hypothetical protein
MRGALSGRPQRSANFMQLQRYIRRNIQRLTPYASLFLLAVPFMFAEPLKLVAVFIFGSGYLLAGLIVMLCAYVASALLVERLFKIVKPKLLTLSWFVIIWKKVVDARLTALRWLKSKCLRKRTEREIKNVSEKRPRLGSPKSPQTEG